MLDPRPTRAVRSLAVPNEERPESIARHLPFVSALDDRTMLLRDGDVMAAFAADGIGAATADGADVEALSNAFAALVAQQGPDVGFTVHRISSRTAPTLGPARADCLFAAAVDARWQAYLTRAGLRQRTTMVSITIRPFKVVGLWAHLTGDHRSACKDALRRRAARLDRIATAFVEVLGFSNARRLGVSDGEWIGLLRCLVGGAREGAAPGARFVPLADLIARSPVPASSTRSTSPSIRSSPTPSRPPIRSRRSPASSGLDARWRRPTRRQSLYVRSLPRRRTTKPRAALRSDFITERRLAMTVRDFAAADLPGQDRAHCARHGRAAVMKPLSSASATSSGPPPTPWPERSSRSTPSSTCRTRIVRRT